MLTSANFEDRQSFGVRLLVLRVATVIAFSLIAAGFWVIQVLQHEKYETLADRQHLRTLPERAPRGVLYDRNGTVLVRNTYSYTIAIVREESADLPGAARRLAEATGVAEATINDILANAKRRRDPLYKPVAIIEHATMAQVAAVAARQVDLPEVVVEILPTREYPGGGMAAHLVGYVGEIQEPQLSYAEYEGLSRGAMVGQAGLERTYDRLLRGEDGKRMVAVNSRGREIESLDEEEPVDGDRLKLTVDADVQRAMEDSFRNAGYPGAGVMLDPGSGEILALTSLPSYDPNAFANGLDQATLNRLLNDPLRPFSNRVIQGTYSPGSAFKIVMAIAGLEEGVITPETTVFCPGHFNFGGRTFKCLSAHGQMDLRRAIEKSCNTFFYTVGSKLDIDDIHKWAANLGLAGKTGVDLPGERESLVPSTEWSRKVRKTPWYPGETISVSIGQGPVNVTPMALATMISTVANGGTVVTPHILKAVDKGDGQGWVTAPTAGPRSEFFIKPDSLQAVRDGLWLVVNGAGTGGRARIAGRDVAGKTGTAQVIGNDTRERLRGKAASTLNDHGFFVFFAPRDKPEIAGVIFAENGLHGSTAAGIAKHVIETYFAKKDGLPLPVLPAPVAASAVGGQ
jgi:penicillin-binding protein 2